MSGPLLSSGQQEFKEAGRSCSDLEESHIPSGKVLPVAPSHAPQSCSALSGDMWANLGQRAQSRCWHQPGCHRTTPTHAVSHEPQAFPRGRSRCAQPRGSTAAFSASPLHPTALLQTLSRSAPRTWSYAHAPAEEGPCDRDLPLCMAGSICVNHALAFSGMEGIRGSGQSSCC